MSLEPLPDGWSKYLSRKFNKVYYYHGATGRSLWVHPLLCQENEDIPPGTTNNENLTNITKIDNCKSESNEYKSTKKTKSGSVETLSSPSTLSEKELHKLSNESKVYRSRTEEIANWAADVSSQSSQTSSLSSYNLNQRNIKNVEEKPSKPTLKPLNSVYKSKKKNKFSETKSNNKNNVTRGVASIIKSQMKTKKRINALKTEEIKYKNKRNNSLTPAMLEMVDKMSKKKTVGSVTDDNSSIVSLSKVRYQPYSTIGSTASKKEKRKNIKLKAVANTQLENDIIKNILDASDKALPSLKPLNKPIPRKRTESECSRKSVSAVSSASEKSKQKANPFFEKKLNSEKFCIPTSSCDSAKSLFSPTFPPPDTIFSSKAALPCESESMHIDATPIQATEFSAQSFIQQFSNEPNILNIEEEMEIDDAVQLNKEIMREIRGIREENIITKPQLSVKDQATLPTYSDPLYIVIDTNILLAHLRFVSELKDYPLPGVGAPILYIPWMVFQELDSLKDAVNRTHSQRNVNGDEEKTYKLNILARKAILFISTCLEQQHPRVKGQTAVEAGTVIPGFVEESNDDSILHCGLSLQTRAKHSYVVLLSNDRNLCNKAIVSGIKAFSQQNVLLGLRSLFQNGTVAVRKENFEEYNHELEIQTEIAARRKQADHLSCELQCMLREAFSKIIEDEMILAYDDKTWSLIVKIQPPWTLHDVFILLDKHWIAVFGMVVKRSLKQNVESLKKLFITCEGNPGELETVQNMLTLSLGLLQGFFVRSNYNGVLTKCIAGVRVLINNCKEYLNKAVRHPQLPPAVELSSLTDTTTQKATEENQPVQSPVMHHKVLETFDAIWRTVTHYSALIFYSLNFPSPLVKDLDPNEAKPSKEEALACLSTMTPCLLNLIKMIQSLLLIPVGDLTHSSQPILNLLQSIYVFMKEVMKRESDMNPKELLQFCQDQKTRAALVQGLSQLDRSYAMLQQCVSYHGT